MGKEKRIVLWGAWYGSRNVGDRALLLAITDMLQQVFEKVKFIILSATPSEVYRYTQRDSSASLVVVRAKKDIFRVINELAKADIFIFGGGVPFFDKPNQLIAMFGLTLLAKFFQVPYFLWSVSSLLIHSRIAKAIFRFVLTGASGITYRDEHTRNLFLACGVADDNMVKVADSAFSLQMGEEEDARLILKNAGWSIENPRPLIGLSPRHLRSKDGEAETHYRPQSSIQYQHEIETFAGVLDWLWEAGYQPIFIPMNSAAPDDDRIASSQIMANAKYGKKALLVDAEIPPRLASKTYGFCKASFVSRVHGSIMSFSANCPTMMYAFDAKHKGIMEVMGLAEFVFDPDNLAPEEATAMIQKLIETTNVLKKELAIKYEFLYRDSFVPQKMILDLFG